MKDFVQLIAQRARHVRHVIVEAGGYKISTVRGAMKALTAAKGLRVLEFDHSILCGAYGKARLSPAELAGDCKTLLKSLQASYKALNLAGSVRDVLSVTLTPCLSCQIGHGSPHNRRSKVQRYYPGICKCGCKEAEEKNAALQREARAVVAKNLGLENPIDEASTA